MAHNPILRVFKIYLKSSKKGNVPSFAELLAAKFPEHGAPSDIAEYAQHYKALFEELLAEVNNNFHTNQKLKKAIGIQSGGDGALNRTISYQTKNTIISGRIKGGRFGQNRSIGDLAAPATAHTHLSDHKVVLDEFYFLLYTPLDSNKGVLLIQNYTSDSVNDVFTIFIKKLLKANGFKQPIVEAYTPKHIQKEFKDASLVQEFRYTDDVFVADIDKTNSIDGQEVRIQVKISIPNGAAPKKMKGLRRLFGNLRIGTNMENAITLEQFRNKMGALKNGGKISSFDLEGSTDIQPTIDLSEKILLQPDGTPIWESLAQYCVELLEEIAPEIYPENYSGDEKP